MAAKMNKSKNIMYNMFSETSEHQLSMVYHTWVYDNFENWKKLPSRPHKLAKIYKSKNIFYTIFQNTSFPMVYHIWFYDNFKILNFFQPPLINWQKWIKLKTYCITCFQKSQNTSFPTVYHTWVYDNFEIKKIFSPLPSTLPW